MEDLRLVDYYTDNALAILAKLWTKWKEAAVRLKEVNSGKRELDSQMEAVLWWSERGAKTTRGQKLVGHPKL